MANKLQFAIGHQFTDTRLFYLAEAPYRNSSNRFITVQCTCGTIKEVCLGSIRSGLTKSCGCYRNEQISKANTVHGLAHKHWLYFRWLNITQRCTNVNHPNYKYYGAKGIGLCDDWRDDFSKFARWVESQNPVEPFDIHREDAAKDYCPSNCVCAPRNDHMRLEAERRNNAKLANCS